MEGGKRCVSGCKGLPEEICTKSPRCTYFMGKKQYCRLSHKFKMTKPDCHITQPMTKKNKLVVARERIKRFFYNKVNSPNKVNARTFRKSLPPSPSSQSAPSPSSLTLGSRSTPSPSSLTLGSRSTPSPSSLTLGSRSTPSPSSLTLGSRSTPSPSSSSLSDELNKLMVNDRQSRSQTRKGPTRRSRARSRR
jgi:hypothetical protein